MSIFDIFRRKGSLGGTIIVRGLPPHRMFSVSVTLFRVPAATSSPPFDGDPPVSEYKDTESVKEPNEPKAGPLDFIVQRPLGFYYVAVGFIAYFDRGEKMIAQVERFFPMTRPAEIRPGAGERVELTVDWPPIPPEELNSYGTIYPSGQR